MAISEEQYIEWQNRYKVKEPNHPLHFYDYRAAFAAGDRPDETGHWPSRHKQLGHPNLIIDGIDTRDNTPATKTTRILNFAYNNLTKALN